MTILNLLNEAIHASPFKSQNGDINKIIFRFEIINVNKKIKSIYKIYLRYGSFKCYLL